MRWMKKDRGGRANHNGTVYCFLNDHLPTPDATRKSRKITKFDRLEKAVAGQLSTVRSRRPCQLFAFPAHNQAVAVMLDSWIQSGRSGTGSAGGNARLKGDVGMVA